MKRRTFTVLGLGALGAVALGYGGSAAVCSNRGRQVALLRTLFDTLDDMIEPVRIGRAYLSGKGAGPLFAELDGRRDLTAIALLPDAQAQRAQMRQLVRADFAEGRSVVVDGWVVSETEALLAGASVA